MPQDSEVLSSVNWWGMIFATVALALFFTGYNAYRQSWAGRKYRKGSAAPSVSHSALGGRPYWRHRVEILPLIVLLCYLGVICSFVRSAWFTVLAVWWFGVAAAIVWIFWLHPLLAHKKDEQGKPGDSAGSDSPTDTGYPRGDDADYVVVSPYERVDSDQRPWWKPRRRE